MATDQSDKGPVTASDGLMDEIGIEVSREELIKENKELQRKAKSASRVALVLGLLALSGLAVIIALLINFSMQSTLPVCGTGHHIGQDSLDEPEHPGIFHELTRVEIRQIYQYLEKTIGTVKPEKARLKDAHIYMMDLEPPKKAEALAYLDQKANSPPRYARVIVFRGDLVPPVVEEHVCGPLDNITSCIVDTTVPFAQRPIEYMEYSLYDAHLIKEMQHLFGNILQESFEGSFDYAVCEEDECLNYYTFPVASNRYGNDSKRRMWILPMYNLPYVSLYPLDFGALCNVDGVDETQFAIEKVWYAGKLYSSPQELLNAYNNGTANKTHTHHPTEAEKIFSTFKHRGPFKPTQPQRPPVLVEPDGKRYSIQHRKINYLDMWSFNYRMSTIYGPALYDIQFLGERIAYEVSLSELAVPYSGYNPMQRQAFYVDTSVLTGSRSKALVAGADCPTSSTFLPLTVMSQTHEEPVVLEQSICIFEHNLGSPLRRHHSYSKDDGAFYGGMLDSALVVRSIHTVDNYDYVVDFTFHQNGAMGVSIEQTGYLLSSAYTSNERPYGAKITDHIYGSIHLHIASFKVDLDISGSVNRYETLDIEEETVQIRQASDPDYTQTKYSFNLKVSELKAAYKLNFDQPMYHIFHNNNVKNMYGERKAFRLAGSGFAKQMLKQDVGNERVLPWARYQIAVSKHNDSEKASSSPYAQWGGKENPVNFTNFIGNDDNIVDEDLVAWVTLAVHHIPHTEDLPVTTTAGKRQSFHLFPFNYFKECPSMMSRDGVYITHKDANALEKGLNFEYYGQGGSCKYNPYDITEPWKKDPDQLLETTYNHGIL